MVAQHNGEENRFLFVGSLSREVGPVTSSGFRTMRLNLEASLAQFIQGVQATNEHFSFPLTFD
jgi:hypothetical protein